MEWSACLCPAGVPRHNHLLGHYSTQTGTYYRSRRPRIITSLHRCNIATWEGGREGGREGEREGGREGDR